MARSRLLSGVSTPILGRAAAAASKLGDIQYAAVAPGPEWVLCNGPSVTYQPGLPVNPKSLVEDGTNLLAFTRSYATGPTFSLRINTQSSNGATSIEKSTNGGVSWTALTVVNVGGAQDVKNAMGAHYGFVYAAGYFLLFNSSLCFATTDGVTWYQYALSGIFFRGQNLTNPTYVPSLGGWVTAGTEFGQTSNPTILFTSASGAATSKRLDHPERYSYSEWAGLVLFDDGTGFCSLIGSPNTYYTANNFGSMQVKTDYPWTNKPILYVHSYRDGKSAALTLRGTGTSYFTRDRGLTWTTVSVSGVYSYGLFQGLYWGAGYNLFGATTNTYSFVLSGKPDLTDPVLTIPLNTFQINTPVMDVTTDISEMLFRLNILGPGNGKGGFELDFTKTTLPNLPALLAGLAGPVLKPYMKVS